MLVSTLVTTSVLLSFIPNALGYPGMGQQMADIMAREDGGADEGDSNELLGDLLTTGDKDLTTVGNNIKELLLGGGNPESDETYPGVPALISAKCGQDTCCVWKYIADDMAKLFRGNSGRCTRWARMAVRLGFHDAGGWSKATASQGGGADGSICLNNELTLPENNGLQDIGAKMKDWYDYWHNKQGFKSVTMADLIQMGATVATVVCPLGPRVRSFVGRKDSSVQNPRLLPSPFQSADELIQMFDDKTIKPHGLVALLGSHTTSQQFFVNTTRAGDPQDSTPGVWDVLFYGQTQGSAPKRVFKFPSDVAISQHPKTKTEWQEFAGQGGQQHWNEDYAREYIRLSLLGVNNINNLTECTKVLPPAIKAFSSPDQKNINKWLNSTVQSALTKNIADAMNNGESVINFVINLVLGVKF
ncbi:ligninase H2 [Xylariales sp. AK1849]|nr:ligninase H2 [Xylariales sp. AK1849]